jgi:predicted aspartyl protease
MFNTPRWESIPSGEIITTGVFLVNQQPTIVLFDSGASHSFISSTFAAKYGMKVVTLDDSGYNIRAVENNISTNQLVLGAKIEIGGRLYDLDLVVLPGLGLDVILGMKWMSGNGVLIDTSMRVVMLRDPKDQQAFLVQLARDVSPQTTVTLP